MTDLSALDATDQAALVRSGEISPTELVQSAIDRAEQVNGKVNAIIHPRYERALEEAAGPLTGQHNDYVFGELLGLGAEEIAELKESGVIA